ncbi:MAG: deoxyribose-phosphate aldolase [Planctomycetes bacterium]|nr:deoxyribose-phosphate aldolase [Planctomycetota bacterium]
MRGDLARMIDHTLLKPDATRDDHVRLCEEAAHYGFWSVCIHPAYVAFCRDLLTGKPVRICTVIGFPLGANTPEVKAFEAEIAQRDGATELDMVMNVGALKSKELAYVESDMRAVVSARHPGSLVKVILETSLLADEEIVRACEIARRVGADFVKTSTGFASGGATATAVALMRRVVGGEMGVKASGGVKDASRAELMLRSGADRIGASASVAIVTGKTEGKGY